jgi:hypothetical protein
MKRGDAPRRGSRRRRQLSAAEYHRGGALAGVLGRIVGFNVILEVST